MERRDAGTVYAELCACAKNCPDVRPRPQLYIEVLDLMVPADREKCHIPDLINAVDFVYLLEDIRKQYVVRKTATLAKVPTHVQKAVQRHARVAEEIILAMKLELVCLECSRSDFSVEVARNFVSYLFPGPDMPTDHPRPLYGIPFKTPIPMSFMLRLIEYVDRNHQRKDGANMDKIMSRLDDLRMNWSMMRKQLDFWLEVVWLILQDIEKEGGLEDSQPGKDEASFHTEIKNDTVLKSSFSQSPYKDLSSHDDNIASPSGPADATVPETKSATSAFITSIVSLQSTQVNDTSPEAHVVASAQNANHLSEQASPSKKATDTPLKRPLSEWPIPALPVKRPRRYIQR
ncbi:hypothetical protein BZG36_03750 [Bifiguratus adelaidae]|uniref:Uncharacterized protein n=1 Tax=Bifiguratus adelaidae TaxID=1938954 RepID=A0A261XY86_9FUNG|nr:hypothetical protein BZG36_03750 [Bifiguratus adelaidae]